VSKLLGRAGLQLDIVFETDAIDQLELRLEEIDLIFFAFEHLDEHIARDKVAYALAVRDFVTRDLFSEILEAEEDHVDFIEIQLDLIPKIGIENYIQLQSGHAE